MSDDIAFKIQLGLFLPKLEETVKGSLTTIIEDHIKLLRDGTLQGEEPVSMETIKEVVMQNIEIFLDSVVLPPIDKKFNPPEEPVAEVEVEETETETEPEEVEA